MLIFNNPEPYTYLRSTMADDFLSFLALMHVHRSFDIDIEYVIGVFANLDENKTALKSLNLSSFREASRRVP